MHIALFNWRDIRNPQAGGAEIVTYEVARRWAAEGHQLTWFAASFEGGPAHERYDDIDVVRRGRQYTVHLHAWRYYQTHLRGNVDVVIDQINTIPFFTPLYVREQVITFVHQLAREVWWYEATFPFSLLGYVMEPLYWKLYKQTPAVTVSPSTAADLRRLKVQRVKHIHNGIGISPSPDPPVPKHAPPTILYLGRVVPSKRVLHLVEALAHAHQQLSGIRLVIAGAGQSRYVKLLARRAEILGVGDHISIVGRVSDEEKRRLLAEAHVLALASVREGWGLVVIEANALGTPAVVYDVPGLRDSVRHNETGIICFENTPLALGRELANILSDSSQLASLSRAAWKHSKQFTWDRTANEMMDAILSVL